MFHPCTVCQQEFPFTADYFNLNKSSKFGIIFECKVCKKEGARRWRDRRHEHHLETKRQYREANREKVRESMRRSYRKHRLKYLEDKKRYVAENREKLRVHWRNMRALRMNAPGKHTEEEIHQLYEAQEGRCGYCGITLYDEYEVEHIRPLSRNGSNDIENLVCACIECNQSKHTSTFEEWKARRGW